MQTPSDTMIRNVQYLMGLRSLGQEQLAERMRAIGFPWHRRTVNRLLRNERRIDPDELFGLAVALDTAVGALISPTTSVGGDSSLASETQIGRMQPLNAMAVRLLIEVPEGELGRCEVRVRPWSEQPDVGPPPQWRPMPWEDASTPSEAIWPTDYTDFGEFIAFNPEIAHVPFNELAAFISEHPKPEPEDDDDMA